MRLLLLTPSLPYPPHQGGAIRNYGLLQGLYDAGHAITLLSFHTGEPDPNTTPLAKLCQRIETVPPPQRTNTKRLVDLVTSGQPDLARRLQSPDFTQCLSQVLSETTFDIIQFEGLEMTGYLPLIRQLQPQAKLCYDAHNAEYSLQEVIYQVDRSKPRQWPVALYSRVQAQRIRQFERTICQAVDYVIAVSEEDAQALRALHISTPVAVIPNGIYIQDYESDAEKPLLDLQHPALVFTGKMDYRPNVDAMLWFTDEIFPQVLAHVPDAHLYIVGQKPHTRLESLRDQANISLTGWVAEVTPFLHATDVYIAPLRMGSGTRLKILEAMAAGCAVVGTKIAVAGLPDDALDTLYISETAEGFAQAIVSLLQDPDRRQAAGQAARASVRKHYDWSLLIPRLLAIYKEMGFG
jgi:glycosyltransferase involved in cell wall biosynthesis